MCDLFDAVETLELEHEKRGRLDGELEARKRQYREGYIKGWQQACHVLREIAVLEATVTSLLASNCKNSQDQRQSNNPESLFMKETQSFNDNFSSLNISEQSNADSVVLGEAEKKSEVKSGFIKEINSELLPCKQVPNLLDQSASLQIPVLPSDQKTLSAKEVSALEKLLVQLRERELWMKLGVESEDKLAQHLHALQAKARFTLRKLNIPTYMDDRVLDSDF